MGNSESSSQFPSRSDGGNQSSDQGGAKRAADEGESQSWSALKVGAAVAETGLLALGAWKLASSSGSSDPQGRRASGDRSETEESMYSYLREATRALEAINLDPLSGSSDDYILERGYYGLSPYPKPNSHLREAMRNKPREIIFMTYNVCSHEGVAVNERMKAIGRLIQQHSPDVIFFQEVTPNIYKIFQSSNRWKTYKCSVTPDEATEGSFCILLSKLPVREFISIRLKSSKGRVLSVAEIDVGMDKKLLAATSHLKSPNPPDNTYRAQAKESIRRLNSKPNSAPNLVFGGDMNWDENLDGLLPLLRSWVDAWAKLRPTEKGWTFDTETNPMLQKKLYPLQKRLDGFLCKLKDFRMISMDMIGMEPIRGLSYRNKAVLASDHYGLFLKIAPKNND